jgi:hypothetical protein
MEEDATGWRRGVDARWSKYKSTLAASCGRSVSI